MERKGRREGARIPPWLRARNKAQHSDATYSSATHITSCSPWAIKPLEAHLIYKRRITLFGSLLARLHEVNPAKQAVQCTQ